MPEIVDPHDGFLSYQSALENGSIDPIKCSSHPNLFMLQDEPEPGVRRLTYALHSHKVAKAYAVYIQAEHMEGKPCFGLGYATAEDFRNQGQATEVINASMEEMRKGFEPHLRKSGFYIEAIVGADNLASQKVAARTVSNTPDKTKDSVSGKPALHYVKLIEYTE